MTLFASRLRVRRWFRERNIARAIRNRARFWLGVLALATLARFGAELHWVLELGCHFTVFYLAGVLFFTAILALLRDGKGIAGGLLVLCLLAAEVAPWYWRSQSEAGPSDVRLFFANVQTSNRNFSGLLQQIEEFDPDVIALIEVDQDWMESLASLSDRFPHREEVPRRDNFGVALLSRYPLAKMTVERLRPGGVPWIGASVGVDDATFDLVVCHAMPPWGRRRAELRNAQFETLVEIMEGRTRPLFLAGDLNVTMWSPFYKNLVRKGNLDNSRRGFGILPTWRAGWFPFMIPIDHALCSEGIEVTHCSTGKPYGSDHLPLKVGFRLKGPTEESQ